MAVDEYNKPVLPDMKPAPCFGLWQTQFAGALRCVQYIYPNSPPAHCSLVCRICVCVCVCVCVESHFTYVMQM